MKISEKEKHDIAVCLSGEETGYMFDEYYQHLDYVAKINYMTDTPGYAGNLYIIVWPSGETEITVLKRNNHNELVICHDSTGMADNFPDIETQESILKPIIGNPDFYVTPNKLLKYINKEAK